MSKPYGPSAPGAEFEPDQYDKYIEGLRQIEYPQLRGKSYQDYIETP